MSEVQGRRWLLLAAAGLAVLPVALDTTVVTVAVPVLARGFGASPAAMAGVVAAPVLVLAGLGPAGARLSARRGARQMLLVGLAVLAAGALAAGTAGGPGRLTLARAVMGVAAAALLPAALRVLDDAFGPVDRRRAVAIWAGFTGLLVVLAPLAGGLLAPGGPAVLFGAVLPVALVAAVAVVRLVPGATSSSATPGRRPLPGAGRGRAEVALAFAAAATLGATYRLVFLLQDGRGQRPLAAGAALLPLVAAAVLAAPRGAALAARIGSRPAAAGGLLVVAGSLGALSRVGSATPLLALEVCLVLLGSGAAVVTAAATGQLLAGTPAGGVAGRQVGSAVGVLALGTGAVSYPVAAGLLALGAVALIGPVSRSRTRAGS